MELQIRVVEVTGRVSTAAAIDANIFFSSERFTMSSSASTTERLKGNESLKRSSTPGIGCTLKKARIQDAIQCYRGASDLASDDDEHASAAKNLAKANWKLARFLQERNEGKVLMFFHLKESAKAFIMAMIKGENCKSSDWQGDIWQCLALCLENLLEACDAIPNVDERMKTLQPIIDELHINFFIVEIHLKIGNWYFHDGLSKIDKDDYAGCLSRMRDCYYPIEEAKRLSGNSEYEISEIEVLEKDVYYATCRAESMQTRHDGSRLLDIAIKEEENLNMDYIWGAIDCFKRATILARELDLEQEAIALGRLGFVYNKVLKLRQRSKTYYKRSFELVESMKPRTFFTENWYKEIVKTLQEFQIEERMWDEQEKQKEREKKLEAVKEEVKQLEENNKGKIALVEYVYNTFPPKHVAKWSKPSDDDVKSWKEMESDTDKLKDIGKVLRTAMTVYHPDKIDVEEHGEKWKTLSEEIYKLLSAHYESSKLHQG